MSRAKGSFFNEKTNNAPFDGYPWWWKPAIVYSRFGVGLRNSICAGRNPPVIAADDESALRDPGRFCGV